VRDHRGRDDTQRDQAEFRASGSGPAASRQVASTVAVGTANRGRWHLFSYWEPSPKSS
jgi:hypothetical protein